ncbi:MAG: bifunctional folylpolyglutamate synthase/dihydrofolate synthase [Phycisphaeraceae bacterium]|nr:bifunctional folylpolyglutamate synthase/dihydrofolate synthase [Phycisphaeraceae bacterium]
MPPTKKPNSRRDAKKPVSPAKKRRRHTLLRVIRKDNSKPAPAIGPGFKGFADLDEAIRFLYSRTNVEALSPQKVPAQVWKLDRMHALMEALENPHRTFRSVHVAGSKGKGSVCEMTSAALIGCGLTTGLYTSPHISDIRERIRLNGEPVSARDFVSLVSEVAIAAESIRRRSGTATFFELMTAAALVHFAREAVDVAVIEVGLGGRLDSTNVITPEVCAITAIQLEHTHILGDTLDKIAREKAGIIKPGIPVLTIPQQKPAVLEAIKEVATRVGAPIAVVGQTIDYSSRYESTSKLGCHMRVSLATERMQFEHVAVPLKGEHQAMNCGLVLSILDRLKERGVAITVRGAAAGLAKTPNPARMEQIYSQPRIIVDGAHNAESIHALMKSLGAHVRYDSLIVIFGCANDKDIPGMLARLGTGADKIIFTRTASNSRAADPRELHRRFAETPGKMSQVAPSLKEAINIAAKAAQRDDLICVTGSFYLAGEAKKLLEERKARDSSARVSKGTSNIAARKS